MSQVVDTGPLGRRRDVTPFVGLRHDGVERIVSSFKGLVDHSYSPTTGAYAGDLLWGRYVNWSGDPAVDRALAESGSWLPPIDAVTAVLQSLELLEPYLSLDPPMRLV